MANLQFTRIKKVFSSRDLAISRLKELSRTYAEGVVVTYNPDNNKNEEELILAIYKSEEKGDFVIAFDSSSAYTNGFRVFRVKKTSESQSDLEAINTALFGDTPMNYDIITIISFDENTVTSYIYYNDNWNILGKGGGNNSSVSIGNLTVSDSDTIKLTLESTSTDIKSLKADVKLDNMSLVYDDEVGGIRVNKIYGGTF